MKTCIIHATFLHLPLSSHSLPLYFFHNFVSQTFHIAMTITSQTNRPVPAATRPTRPKHSRNARSHHPLFPPGTKAQIIGLNAKPHYNGCIGTAGWYYPNKERIAITIQEDGCSHTLSIKLCNLCTIKVARQKAYMSIAPILAKGAWEINQHILKKNICQHYFRIVESTIISMKTDLRKHRANIPSLPMMMYNMDFQALLKYASAITKYGEQIHAFVPPAPSSETVSYSEEAVQIVENFMSHMGWSLLFL